MSDTYKGEQNRAKDTSFTPAGTISSRDVQAAIQELASESAQVGTGASSVPFVTGAGIDTTGSIYEIVTDTVNGNKYLKLKVNKTFVTTVANSISSPPAGWTWADSAGLTIASQGAVNGRLVTHNSTNTDWAGVTRNGPRQFRAFTRDTTGVQYVIARIASDGNANYERAGVIIYDPATPATYTDYCVGYHSSGGGLVLMSRVGDSSEQYTTVTSGQRDAGVWVMILLTLDGAVEHYYSLSGSSTVPTTWTFRRRSSAGFFSTLSTMYAATISYTGNTSGSHTSKILYYDDTGLIGRGLPFVNTVATMGAEGVATTGTEISLLSDWDIGTSGATINQTRLRQILSDITNSTAYDTATVTFSVKQSATVAATSGTYYAPGSVVVSGTGRYVSLWVKILANTTLVNGSVRLPFYIPISAT